MRILTAEAALRRVRKLESRSSEFCGLEPQVRRIVENVRRKGDRALRDYARKWDGLAAKAEIRVAQAELEGAWAMADRQLRTALEQAAANIRRFCQWQRPREWRRSSGGISVGQVVRPLESVGCYVPGGRHPLVSTLLMTVIPAQVAGVTNIRVVSPAPKSEVLAAAHMLGIREVYRIGGAQAVAALAYGTSSVPRVDKIVGPGNIYVTLAKKLVSFNCAIDFLAGPTEVVILSDKGRPEFVAADLVAQAEHDPAAVSIFITTSKQLGRGVRAAVKRIAEDNATARQSLARNGAVLLARSREEALAWANRIAPEHITVDSRDLDSIQNAGSIFVGDYTAQAAGDYASGPNHVLPTAGMARFRGGLSVHDFVKVITVQELSKSGLSKIGNTVAYLAEAEGLRAHAQSIRVRCPDA
ncbi:MAG: histidinol dehydrogenase [Terriglobales bacterium]